MKTHSLADGITVADQPTTEDLETLKNEGFTSVANLRNAGEPDQPMGPGEEEERVRALGMDYLHRGFGAPPWSEEAVAEVCGFLDRHAGDRVLVHCRKGGRAAALVLIHRALREGWKPSEALARGKALGLEVEGKLAGAVEDYLAGRDHAG